MKEHFDNDELAFFLDMAMNESQRWLEVTCRELFIDNNDFAYSLRYGTHLRKITNKIVPDCFDLSHNYHEKDTRTRTTRQILAKAKLSYTKLEDYIDDEDWISQFLLICMHRFHIPWYLLFLREDLEQFDNLEKPYREFIEQQLLSEVAESSKCDNYDSLRIRRLCVTISALYNVCSRNNVHVSQLDHTALEPLIQYHLSVYRNYPNPSVETILVRPNFDLIYVVSTLVEQVSFSDEINDRTQLNTPSSDEGVVTIMDYNYTVKKYLDQLNNGYSTEELSSYSAGTNGSRSGPSCWSDQNSSAENSDQLIPTRQQLKFASQVAHNPLQFVSAQTGATALCEQAKQQLIISDQQKRLREEIRKKMYTDEDEADWKTNLDSWLSKRKMAISRWKNDMQHAANDSDRNRECDVAQSQVFEQQQQKQQQKQQQQKRQQRQQEHRSRNDSIIDPKKQRDDCLTFAPSPLEEHQEDSGIENNCRSSSIDDHSPATSLDFLPPIGLNQLDTRNSFNTSLSPSPSNQHYYCYQHLELSLPEKSFFDHPTITTSENGYSVPSTSKLLRTDTITKADLPEQNQSRSVTPQADNSQQYFGENSDSDSDFPAPPDYLLPETAVQSKIRTINLYDQEKQLINCTNMKSNSTNNSISTTKREPLSTLTGKRNTSIAAREAIKFPITRQTNPSCQKGILEISDGNIQSETNTINKSKQASLSSFLPYTSTTAKLSSDQARGHHGGATDTIYPRTSPKISRTNRLANEVHELTVPKSHLKTVDIQFEDKPGAAYQPSNIERNNTKMSQQVGGIGEMINVKINLENDDRIDERKHFGFTVTGGKDKNAPVKIDAVIVGTPADQAGLQVGDLLLSINGESVMDRYYQCVVRMLHEAERLGNIELRIRRSDNAVIGPRISAENQSPIIDQRSTISFDQKRALFDDKYITKNSNYKGIRKQKHSSPPTRKWPMGNLNKHPENATPVAITAANAHNVKDVIVTRSNSALSSISALDDDDPRVTYISGGKCSMRHSRERFSSRTSLASSTSCSITGGGTDPDYRVTSLHDKPKPGKLADFIPEVERKSDVGYEQDDGASAYSSSFSRQESDVDGFTNLFTSEDDGEAPLVLRNYDITPVRSVTTSPIQHKISYWMKKDEARTMSLPRNIGGEYRRNGYVVPCNLPITTKSITQRDIISSEENVANNGSQPKNSSMDCREWRELIEQQRLPSPGDPESRNRIDADLKLEVRPNKDTGTHQNTRCGNGKLSRQISQSEATRMKKSNSSIENFSSADELLISRKLLENNRSTASNSNRAHASNEQNNRKVSNKLSTATDEPLLSVSGKHRCSHCAMELGRGAAMIIESLNLFYHLSCFRCYVCKMTLGNGSRGTDVRVRDSKLHCQSCYSNEESGLKFSKV